MNDGKWEARCHSKKKKLRKKVTECVVLVVVKQQQGSLWYIYIFFFTMCTGRLRLVFSLQLICRHMKRRCARTSFCVSVCEKRNVIRCAVGGEVSSVLTQNELGRNNGRRLYVLYRKEIFRTKCTQTVLLRSNILLKYKIKRAHLRIVYLNSLHWNTLKHTTLVVNSLICGYADKGGKA